jgi:hypothetical protein
MLVRRDVSTTIDLMNHIGYSERRKRGIKKAEKCKLRVVQSDDFNGYMDIVKNNLLSKYGVKPVHSSQEIERLAWQFPENIKLYISLTESGNIAAGVIIYETNTVAHAQYIASTEEGRKFGALDMLFDQLIKCYHEKKRYFDFGISTENDGWFLNSGLIEQKEGFGARAVVYDHYLWDLNS